MPGNSKKWAAFIGANNSKKNVHDSDEELLDHYEDLLSEDESDDSHPVTYQAVRYFLQLQHENHLKKSKLQRRIEYQERCAARRIYMHRAASLSNRTLRRMAAGSPNFSPVRPCRLDVNVRVVQEGSHMTEESTDNSSVPRLDGIYRHQPDESADNKRIEHQYRRAARCVQKMSPVALSRRTRLSITRGTPMYSPLQPCRLDLHDRVTVR